MELRVDANYTKLIGSRYRNKNKYFSTKHVLLDFCGILKYLRHNLKFSKQFNRNFCEPLYVSLVPLHRPPTSNMTPDKLKLPTQRRVV